MVTAALLPTLLVVGSLMLVFGLRDAGLWHNLKVPAGRWRWLPFGSLFVLQMFYVVWRVSDTVPPLGWSIEGLWPLVFLVFELSGMLMLSLTYLTLSRKTDRSPEVDEHLGLLGEQTFRVAMFIPTYNEPKAVLERTILGAMSQRYPGVRVYVLDDSRRDWLRDYCRQIGVGYCRRNDNKGAKAGNMNAGLATVRAEGFDPEFIGVLDADFIARPDFISRCMVLHLRHPEAGIIQTPQHFFNPDPVQMNLVLADVAPDEQRFFFDEQLAARDAWGTAFCCGTSSLIRVAALEAIRGFPTESVTEDMLMSLRMREHGWQTLYLNEPLTTGLSPEGLGEYIKQRHRWCLGFIQIFKQHYNPFSRRHRLKLMDRIHVFDTFLYWVMSFPTRYLFLAAPAVYWFTGWLVIQASIDEILLHLLPWLIAHMVVMTWISRGALQPLLNDVSQLLLGPAAIHASITGLFSNKPHEFVVTPKGELDTQVRIDWQAIRPLLFLGALTLSAVVLAAFPFFQPALPFEPRVVNLFWLVINLVIIALGMLSCIELPRRRAQERFTTPAAVPARLDVGDIHWLVEIVQLSMSGCQIRLVDPSVELKPVIEHEGLLHVDEFEQYHVQVRRLVPLRDDPDAVCLGCQFSRDNLQEKLQLTSRIFAEGHARLRFESGSLRILGALLKNLLVSTQRH